MSIKKLVGLQIWASDEKHLAEFLLEKSLKQEGVTLAPLNLWGLLIGRIIRRRFSDAVDFFYPSSYASGKLVSLSFKTKRFKSNLLFLEVLQCFTGKSLVILGLSKSEEERLRYSVKRLVGEVNFLGVWETPIVNSSFERSALLVEKINPRLLFLNVCLRQRLRWASQVKDEGKRSIYLFFSNAMKPYVRAKKRRLFY